MRDYNKEIPCRTCKHCLEIYPKLNSDAIDREKYGICIVGIVVSGLENTKDLSIVQKDTAGCELHTTKEEKQK